MVSSAATTVDAYLAALPADRRDAIARVREVVNAHLPSGYVEGMLYGMIGWYVPLARYPDTYNGQPLGIAGLASQKNHMALYLTSVYGDPALETWFRGAYAAAGKKLDMGKSCVRFTRLDAVPLEVIGETIAKVPVEQFLARYEAVRAATRTGAGRPKSARAVRAAKRATTRAAVRTPARTPTASRAARKATANRAARKATAKQPARKVTARQPARKQPAARSARANRGAKASARTPARKPAPKNAAARPAKRRARR